MNAKRITVLVLRVLLALTFIFSGFVKAADPWGTAIKFGEYFNAFGLEWLYGARFVLSVLLSGAELALGLALLFGVRLRLISLFTMLFMLFFTVLTFVIALGNPVEDCGCFGDAVKLTNWQTLYKNLILLPMSIAVWLYARSSIGKIWTAREFSILVLLGAISCGVGCYSLLHLPIIDFLPYKIGVDLSTDNAGGEVLGDVQTTLIYRDKSNGDVREFELSDTTWYDTLRWEYVDTRIVMENQGLRIGPSKTRDFAIFDAQADATAEILAEQAKVVMFCVTDMSDIPATCAARFGDAVVAARAKGLRVICVTPMSLDGQSTISFAGEHIECYNIDATTLKTLLRARNGMVVLDNGVIVDKRSCRDITPNF